MKLCPLCQHCYEDRFISCTHDRSTLIGDRPGACVVAQKYSLDRLLTSGGAQALYAGKHLETGRPYAIMLLPMAVGDDAKALKNLRREALATAHLNTRFDHQHAAKTYDYGLLPDGTVYVITELIVGQSLRQYMDETKPLPVAMAVHIAQQVADGLEAAHRCGVVHHGLEPANIILVRDYYQQLEAKIIEFGFASLLKQGAEDDGPVSPYVAPERRMGQNADARSDIYSLGVILYEMLAGRLPFGDGAATAAGHDNEAEQLSLAWLQYEMPEPLAQLLTQQLHARPTERPLSAADVAERLRAIGNILVSGYTDAPAEDGQASAASEPPIPILGLAASQLPIPDDGIQSITLPTADLRARTQEFELDDAKVVTYVDLNLPQEESGRNLDESIVMAPMPAQLAGAIQPKAANVMRRAHLLYVVYATAIILGLAGGLWVGSREASLSPPATSQAPLAVEATGQTEPVAFAKTSPADGVGEPLAGDVNSTPGGVENPSQAATPVTDDEHTARRSTAVDEAQGSKEPEANPSVALAEQPRGAKAAIGSYVSAGRESGQRPGGPCRLLVSERSLSIRAGGGSDTITVSSQSVDGPARVTASTKNWPDIVVFPESRGNPGGPVKYSVISVSKRSGTFAVNFNSPCGVKTVRVTVQ
jgi:serine/threonine protein kinase